MWSAARVAGKVGFAAAELSVRGAFRRFPTLILRVVMKDDTAKITFEPRPLKVGHEWQVVATWPSGHTEYITGFVDESDRATSAILWTLNNHVLTPVCVHTGLSDETHTQVDGPGLTVGTAVVTGVLEAGNQMSSDAPSKNPFQSPRPSGGDKGG